MVIIFGGSGYVGKRFVSYLQQQSIDVQSISRAEVNYHDPSVLRALLKERRPDFVINAAGFTGKPNVDACEFARAETLFGNVVLPLRIGEACAELGIPWGHISSGCIYTGDKGVNGAGEHVGFTEEDEPNFSFKQGNCSYYSGTKAQAEEWLLKNDLLLKAGPDSPAGQLYIWRLRVPFDQYDSPRNFVSKLMRYEWLVNVRNSLSHLDDYVASCWATFSRKLPPGIYNVTNPGSITAEEVVAMIREEGESRLARGDKESVRTMIKSFKFFPSEEAFMKVVKTPRSNCVMDTTKAEKYNLPLRPLRQALQESLQQWVWEKP